MPPASFNPAWPMGPGPYPAPAAPNAAPVPATSPGPVRIDLLDHWDAAAADWALLETQGHCSAFQTRAWLEPFYRLVAPARGWRPLILRVSDARNGRPLLLWPLVRQRLAGVALLRAADLGQCDYNAPLLCADWPRGPLDAHPAWQATWQAVLQRLARAPGWPVAIQVDKVCARVGDVPNPLLNAGRGAHGSPAHSSHHHGLANNAPARARPLGYGAWAVDLPADIAHYHARQLHPGFAKDLAKRRRRLARTGPVCFGLATTRDERQAAFDTLVRQRARRFSETNRRNILDDPLLRQAYAHAAIDAPGDTVRLFTLRCGDTTVATLLAIDHAGTRHAVLPTFEAGEWRACSPGNLVLLMALEDAITQGLRRFDFTIGDEPFKADFGTQRQPLWRVIAPLHWSGHGYLHAHHGARRLRAWWRAQRREAVAAETVHAAG